MIVLAPWARTRPKEGALLIRVTETESPSGSVPTVGSRSVTSSPWTTRDSSAFGAGAELSAFFFGSGLTWIRMLPEECSAEGSPVFWTT